MKNRNDEVTVRGRGPGCDGHGSQNSDDGQRVPGWLDTWDDVLAPPQYLPRDEPGFLIEPTVEDFVKKQDVRYEPPREYARRLAREFVVQHLLEDIDPDQLMITTLYVLDRQQAPRTANIAYSMTLTDALMRNWQQNGNGEFLEHLSVLRPYREGGYPSSVSRSALPLWECFAYEAIYHRTTPQRFDESTHMALEPKAFKRFVWDANLQSHYLDSLDHFWARHESNYNLLIKAALLKSAYVQHEEGSLSDEDKALVLRSVGLSPRQAWADLTFDAFVDAPLPGTVTFRELIVYRYTATDIIVIVDEQAERLVAYIPGNSSPLHGFKSLTALRQWFALQCKDPQKRKSLESHFKIADDGDGVFLSGVHTSLAGLAVYPRRLNDVTGIWDPSKEITLGPAISPWPFSHFRQNLKERLSSDAMQTIRTQADYSKEIAAQGLVCAINATGMIAMVVPALWLPLSAMALALTGLGVDEVINGKTTEKREQGAERIVFGVLNALPELARGLEGVEKVAPGAADEVGQMVANRSIAQQAEAAAELESAQVQAEEETLARTSEDPGQRAMRLHQEEQQRLALKTEREATQASRHRFGVEPQGLRSLTPDLRAALFRFEYKGTLENGEWIKTDLGATFQVRNPGAGKPGHFVRLHTRTYPAQWVEANRQYRIVSLTDDTLKGPYVKPLQGFYSDLDLKPGLRGGESFSEALAETKPDVQAVAREPGIELARGQPTVQIEVPMDGIELRTVSDSYGNPIQRYFALNTPEGTNVYYDADVACWKGNESGKLLWRDHKGRWASGSEKRYSVAREKLRYGVRNEVYKFPRLPGLPSNPQPLDRTIHHIWMGKRLPGAHLIETMKQNIRTSPDLKFVLHIDIEHSATLGELTPQQQLEAEFADFPRMNISDLHDEPFFDGFVYGHDSAEPFAYFRHGPNQNLAAASDVLRYRLLREYGGIYMDCDDVLRQSFEGQSLVAGPSDVLVGASVNSETLGFLGPNTSHFASHRANPVLREMEAELYRRFAVQAEALETLKASASADIRAYMTQISHVTGPGLFFDTIKKMRPDYAGLLDQGYKPGNNIFSLAYAARLRETEAFYAPFAERLRIRAGSENSWKAS